MNYKCFSMKKTPVGINTSNIPLSQSIKNDIKLSKSNIEETIQIKESLEWNNFENINNNFNSFGKCENKEGVEYQSSPLILSFKNFNIEDTDEIQDINLRLKLQSNTNLNSKISVGLNGTSALIDTSKTEIGYPKENKNINIIKGNKKWMDLPASLNTENTDKTPQSDYSLERYEAVALLNSLNNIDDIVNENEWLSELNRIVRETEKILKEKIDRKKNYNEIIIDVENKLNFYIQNSKMYWYVYDDKQSKYVNSGFELLEGGNNEPFLKNNHWTFFIDTGEPEASTKESSIICRTDVGTYIVNDFKKASTDWIEYKNFGIDVSGTIENIEFEIEGSNYSSNSIICNIQGICNDKKTGIFQIGNIEVGGFNNKIKLDKIFNISEINSKDFSVRISFSGLDNASMIEIYKTNLKVNYITNKRTIKEFSEINNFEIASNPTTKWYLIKNLQGLILPSGKDLKNNILTFIDFGKLQNNEYIKFYSAEMIIHYKNRKGNSISKSIESPISQIEINNEEILNISKIININSTTSKINNPVIYTGMIKNDEPSIEQNESEVIHNEPLGLTLKHQIFQMFEANTPKISAIEFGVAGLNGNPSRILFLEVLENSNQNKPNKSIYKRTVEGWNISNTDNVKYDVNIDNLVVGEKYWIKLSTPSFDNNNFYKLQYKENVSVFNNSLIQKENNKEVLVNSGIASLKFKIYKNNNLRAFTKKNISADIEKEEVNIENTFLRKNSSSNIELKNISLRYGDYDEET